MADLLKVFQNVAQVEVQDPPLLKVSQNVAQVEVQDPPLLKVFQVIAQVEYDPIIPPMREFPVPNPNRVLQSQLGKREFPIVA